LNVLEAVKQAGAGFRSLKDAWCDTTTPHGVLMLTVLGGLAEFERTLIKARTGEGRERAEDEVCGSDARSSSPRISAARPSRGWTPVTLSSMLPARSGWTGRPCIGCGWSSVARPRLEVADILRRHGAAWPTANTGHVSLGQLKVMSAIEDCRTAALGGHVARCENEECGHIRAHKSRNRSGPSLTTLAHAYPFADFNLHNRKNQLLRRGAEITESCCV
jgi:hypothetical protein